MYFNFGLDKNLNFLNLLNNTRLVNTANSPSSNQSNNLLKGGGGLLVS
jgi:hypothetical protein